MVDIIELVRDKTITIDNGTDIFGVSNEVKFCNCGNPSGGYHSYEYIIECADCEKPLQN